MEKPVELLELNALGLDAEAIAALRRQGFVSREMRRGRTLYKLRYRIASRQVVRCLGTDSERAGRIEAELSRLQRSRKHDLALSELVRKNNAELREVKRRTEPLVAELGYVFHGRELRRPRRSTGPRPERWTSPAPDAPQSDGGAS